MYFFYRNLTSVFRGIKGETLIMAISKKNTLWLSCALFSLFCHTSLYASKPKQKIYAYPTCSTASRMCELQFQESSRKGAVTLPIEIRSGRLKSGVMDCHNM